MQTLNPQPPGKLQEPGPAACGHCNISPAEGDFPTPLCRECRQSFVRYPIPRWIWLFAGGVVLVMLAGFFRMPKYLAASVHLARAERAITAHKYVTAQRELLRVNSAFPADVKANCALLIASAYNLDLATAMKSYELIKSAPIEDKDQFAAAERALEFLTRNMVQDTAVQSRIALAGNDPGELERIGAEADSVDNGWFATYTVADRLYDLKLYDRSAALLGRLLEKKPGLYVAQMLLIADKRNLGAYDEAIAACDQLLRDNLEDFRVIAYKAKIELKRRDDAQAGKYALQAMALAPNELAPLEAMAAVRYYTGRRQEAGELLTAVRRIEAGSGDSTISMRLAGLFNGTETYR